MTPERLAEIMRWHVDCECGCAEVAADVVRLRSKVSAVESLIELAQEAEPPYRNILHAWAVRSALTCGEES